MVLQMENTKDNVIRARVKPSAYQEHIKLMARLNLTDTHGAEANTIRQAHRLANKHLDLIKDIHKFLDRYDLLDPLLNYAKSLK